jgi:hypothetical protein
MLSLLPAVRVFVALEPTDMRKPFHAGKADYQRSQPERGCLMRTRWSAPAVDG